MGCMPYGRAADPIIKHPKVVSIPHMGCMPYGPPATGDVNFFEPVSIPHMGCMPYGPDWSDAPSWAKWWFQSLIWVACPTG